MKTIRIDEMMKGVYVVTSKGLDGEVLKTTYGENVTIHCHGNNDFWQELIHVMELVLQVKLHVAKNIHEDGFRKITLLYE
jgi:hypothetical protein